jgi:hypothetical protein
MSKSAFFRAGKDKQDYDKLLQAQSPHRTYRDDIFVGAVLLMNKERLGPEKP